jgi:hypothetical protein
MLLFPPTYLCTRRHSVVCTSLHLFTPGDLGKTGSKRMRRSFGPAHVPLHTLLFRLHTLAPPGDLEGLVHAQIGGSRPRTFAHATVSFQWAEPISL